MNAALPNRALIRHLNLRLPWCELANYPSQVHPLPEMICARAAPGTTLFIKREDISSSVYGGNKVRSLELLLAEARASGARAVCAPGASGSNYVAATALHAVRVGLECRAVVFKQPPGSAASANQALIRTRSEHVTRVPHWSLLPAALLLERQRCPPDFTIMPPGGASALGVLGHVSAALELGEQVAQKLLPAPHTVVVGLGTGATAAGLLLGFWLASYLRVGLTVPPRILAVRVAPWPLSSRAQVLTLARRAARQLALLTNRMDIQPPWRALWNQIQVDGSELGKGYGYPTRAGQSALELWDEARLGHLDLTYSAKAAASFLRFCSEQARGTVLFWSTKSSVPLPSPYSEIQLR